MRDDRIRVARVEPAVPDAIGIDDGVGSVEAGPEATTRCRKYTAGAAREQLLLHRCENLVTAPAPTRGFSAGGDIRADKQVAHVRNRR